MAGCGCESNHKDNNANIDENNYNYEYINDGMDDIINDDEIKSFIFYLVLCI